MPILQLEVRRTNHMATYTFKENLDLAGVKRINSITVNRLDNSYFDPAILSHAIDGQTGAVSLQFSQAPSTGSQSAWATLNSSTIQGDERVCRYSNSTTKRISSHMTCASQIPYTRYLFQYNVTIDYEVNTAPMITSETPDLDGLLENEVYVIHAEVNEPDAGDKVTVYCQINDDVPQNIGYFTSDSTPLELHREFRYQDGRLVDLTTDYSIEVEDGVLHTAKIWAADEYGGQSEVLIKEFTVDSNQVPVLTVEPITEKNFLLENEQLVINGTVSDGNGGVIQLSYRLNNGPWIDTYEGLDSPYSILIPLALLAEGENIVHIRVQDEFNAADQRTVVFTKELKRYPRLESDMRYRINIPSRKAEVITLKVIREIGDLAVTATVSMTGGEADELFVAMTKTGTQSAGEGLEEDTFTYTAAEEMEKILFGLTMTRQQATSTQKITRISGMLN